MKRASRLVLVTVTALLVPIIPFAVVGELPGDKWLSAAGDDALLFGMTGAALLASDTLLPIPSSIVGTLLGARLGFLPGLIWCWVGLLIGNALGYAVGRLLLSRFATPLPKAPSLLLVFVTRPVPVLAEAMAVAAGAEKTPFLPFLSAAAAGNLCYGLVLAGNGAALIPDGLLGAGLIIPMALPVVAWVLWRWTLRREQGPSASPADG